MYKQKLDNILNQELTRQEFLKAGGAILLTLIGLPAIINAISNAFSGSPKQVQSKAPLGYGGRSYGK